ncbi:MAG: tail fiber domain-containing protein, partial [Microvirga sp.]
TRNQPLNEISALMSGGQVTMPQFSAYRGGQMAETPVGQYVYQSNQIAQDGARAKAQAAASERAGLFNLAGTLLGTGAKMLR